MHLWLIFYLSTLLSFIASSPLIFQFNILPKKPIFIYYLQNIFESVEDLCIGTPSVCLKTQFDPSTSISYFNNHEKDDPYTLSIPSSHYSYRATFVYPMDKMTSGILFNDKAVIGPMQLNEFSLFSPLTLLSYARNSSVIGLQYKRTISAFTPFIICIYSNNVISHESYSIQYLDKDKGQIIFGQELNSSTFNNTNKNNTLEKVFETQLYLANVNLPYIKADIVTIGESFILPSIMGEYNIGIDESFSFIQMPFELRSDLLKGYGSLMSKCSEYQYEGEKVSWRDSNMTYYYYLCDKANIDKKYIQTLSPIQFHFGNEIIKLLPDNLFEKYSDKEMIFNIVLFYTQEENQLRWIIGSPILRKYLTEHNYDKDEYEFKLFIDHDIGSGVNKSMLIFYLFIIVGVFLIIGSALLLFNIILEIKR